MINWLNLLQAALCLAIGAVFFYWLYNDDKKSKHGDDINGKISKTKSSI